MEVKQVATILNNVYSEVTGKSAVINEDLSNVVDIGKEILGATDVDNYVKSLINHIGKVIFVDRTYSKNVPQIMTDSWTFGSALEKVRVEVDDFVENDSWKLTKGTSVDPFKFNPPSATAKFYNKMTTFELDISFTELEVRESFSNVSQLNSFFSTIENRIRMKIELANESLIMRTIDFLMAQKIHSKNNVVNLLTMYNAKFGTTLTAGKALTDKGFLRYSAQQIKLYESYLSRASMLYNDGGYVTFTPPEMLRKVLLTEFASGMEVYLQSDTFHNDLVKLGNYTDVPYWQGTGTKSELSFDEISKIDIKIDDTNTVTQKGIVGVMFDVNACMICNENQRVTSIYQPKQEFYNYFYKFDARYLVDTMENCVVFVVADSANK